MPYDRSDLPDAYARQYLPAALRMNAGQVGALIRQYAPAILPGVPPEIFLAFVAPGSQYSDTTQGTSAASQEVSFREVGLYQTPAGARGGPSPAQGSAYARLAYDPAVQQVLGRPADTSELAWRNSLSDQTAIGLADLRDNYNAAVARMDPSIKPSSPGTPWGTWIALGAFSAGPAGMADLANHYQAQLAAVPEADRVGELVNAMALDIQNHVPLGGAPDRHSTLAHRVLRDLQKFRLAQAIAQAIGDADAVAYFDTKLGDQQALHDEIILRGNWHDDPGAAHVDQATFPEPSITEDIARAPVGAKVAGVAIVGAVLFALWQWFE